MDDMPLGPPFTTYSNGVLKELCNEETTII